ncbi:ArsR/SmtB family transcription factor [Fictibacillus macauensis]|uniref:ArsR/SmtB family transcription factor n=1 Tax=Fictibacillus macauensis TaxID=245160 RepID=UPI003B75BFFC
MELTTAAAILKVLGDKTRLAIVKSVFEQECCVCEFVAIFDMSQPAVSQHLRKLKDHGIVKERRSGQWIYYSMNTDYPYYAFVQQLVNHLPSQREGMSNLQQDSCCEN